MPLDRKGDIGRISSSSSLSTCSTKDDLGDTWYRDRRDVVRIGDAGETVEDGMKVVIGCQRVDSIVRCEGCVDWDKAITWM